MYTEFQEDLLRTVRNVSGGSLTPAIEQAFLCTPRHLFVKKFYQLAQNEWKLTVIDEHNLAVKLSLLYQDTALVLEVDEERAFLAARSSISQPSLVLSMLKKLDIREGHSVLEIGTGSGWNAAMMGRLAGPAGNVCSVEIHPGLARMARETIAGQGIMNVEVIEGDGGDGYAPGGPYDRIMFTVGSYDIPAAFYEQLKEGGLLLMVLKNTGFGDTLYLFKKAGDHLEAIQGSFCAFVGMQGKYEMRELRATAIGELPFWDDIQGRVAKRQSFWCGGKSQSNDHFVVKSAGFISFLGITEPWFRVFEEPRREQSRLRDISYGVVDIAHKSVALLSHDDKLTAYGSKVALERLLGDIRLWQEMGMPNAACFGLKAYPADASLVAGYRQWIIRRMDSQFLWTLESEVSGDDEL